MSNAQQQLKFVIFALQAVRLTPLQVEQVLIWREEHLKNVSAVYQQRQQLNTEVSDALLMLCITALCKQASLCVLAYAGSLVCACTCMLAYMCSVYTRCVFTERQGCCVCLF